MFRRSSYTLDSSLFRSANCANPRKSGNRVSDSGSFSPGRAESIGAKDRAAQATPATTRTRQVTAIALHHGAVDAEHRGGAWITAAPVGPNTRSSEKRVAAIVRGSAPNAWIDGR